VEFYGGMGGQTSPRPGNSENQEAIQYCRWGVGCVGGGGARDSRQTSLGESAAHSPNESIRELMIGFI
jgi:hypothetical protein